MKKNYISWHFKVVLISFNDLNPSISHNFTIYTVKIIKINKFDYVGIQWIETKTNYNKII